MRSFIGFLATIVFLAGVGYGGYAWLSSRHGEAPPALPTPSTTQSPVVQATVSRTIHYPVPTEPGQTKPLTGEATGGKLPATVDESDQSITDALIGLFGKERFASLFIPKDIVRRIVVTIDNATRHLQLSQDQWPLKPPESRFLAAGKGEDLRISPRNYRRYRPYVDLIQKVSTRKLVAVYTHFYPLFQAAYRDLGTQGYFNDRLVEVIDELLKTPEVKGPIKVVRLGVHARYRYADDQLEHLSSGQKLLVRMGYENAQVIKAKLRRLRARLTHLSS